MPEQQIHQTAASPNEVAAALQRAMVSQGIGNRGDVLALLLTLVDLETNTFRNMFGWNLGNIIVLPEYADQVPWYRANDSGNPRRFRAYPTLDAGAEGLLDQLTRDSRKQWRAGLLTGTPRRFVMALAGKNGGPAYFEAPFQRYLRGFVARYQAYKPLKQRAKPRSSSSGTDTLLGWAITGAISLLASYLALRSRR